MSECKLNPECLKIMDEANKSWSADYFNKMRAMVKGEVSEGVKIAISEEKEDFKKITSEIVALHEEIKETAGKLNRYVAMNNKVSTIWQSLGMIKVLNNIYIPALPVTEIILLLYILIVK